MYDRYERRGGGGGEKGGGNVFYTIACPVYRVQQLSYVYKRFVVVMESPHASFNLPPPEFY